MKHQRMRISPKAKAKLAAGASPDAGTPETLVLSNDPTPKPSTPARPPRDFPRVYIPDFNLSFLIEDPNNARTDFNEDPAFFDSIAEKGIQEPLWIRILENPTDAQRKEGITHVLIAGANRTRNAKKAGKLTAPVFDYDKISDEDAAELADLSNCQRKDLSAAERALYYAKMVEKHGWQWWDEKTPDRSLSHRFNLKGGKSGAYEWARIAKLPKLAHEGMTAGKLSRSVAIQLAKIAEPSVLKEAIGRAIAEGWTDDRAAEVIAAQYLAQLPKGYFDPADATLHTAAGACTTCPYLSGNAPEFTKGRGDICFRPRCLRQKIDKHFDRLAKEHEKKGNTVWSVEQAKKHGLNHAHSELRDEFIDLATDGYLWRIDFSPGNRPMKEHLAKLLDGAPIILAQHPITGRIMEILPADVVKAMLLKLGKLKKEPQRQSGQENENRKKTMRAKALIARQLAVVVERMERQAPAFTGKAGELFRLAVWYLAVQAGHDTVCAIVKRRNLIAADFKLSTDASAETLLRGAILAEKDHGILAGYAAEIIAHVTPGWGGEGAKLDQKSYRDKSCAESPGGRVLEFLSLESKTLQTNAEKDQKAAEEAKKAKGAAKDKSPTSSKSPPAKPDKAAKRIEMRAKIAAAQRARWARMQKAGASK